MRYRHQALLKEIGEKGQALLETKTVSIVGLGGVGSVLADLLARNGIGLRLIDKDRVYEEDMARQALYLHEQVQKFKAKEAKKCLEDINPQVKVRTFHEELVPHNVYLIEADSVVDCSNDAKTNELIDGFCRKLPLLVCRYAGTEGLIYRKTKGHSFATLKAALAKYDTIQSKGVLSSASQFGAALLYAEVLKVLLGKPDALSGLLTFNAWKGTVKVRK